MTFSRGLYSGWMHGVNHQELVAARFGKKRGVYLGEVTRVLRDAVVVQLEGPLKPGDGVVFDAGKPEENEEGGRVYEVGAGQAARLSPFQRKNETGATPVLRSEAIIHFGHGDIDFSRVHVGDKLWKTSDPELDRRLRQSFAGSAPKFQRPIELEIHGIAGKPLTLIVRDEFGHVAKVESALPLTKAENQPLTTERLRGQLGRLGGTPFKLGGLTNELTGEVMLAVSELNRLRREAVAELERQRMQPRRWMLEQSSEGRATRVPDFGMLGTRVTRPSEVELIVLVRNLAQFEAALKYGVQTIYCDFENPKKYREVVALARRPSTINDLRRPAAHFQNGRGMDTESGPLLQR